ncbi:DUF1007 family protein [uncultured Fibrobacter sp.]|uniref:DUF1007 family protein n=1 Tax=uncultured Fibrobacter sp. TaxID=261512 RepID=UPI0026182EC6|nr:DUF1007 family protein [uncultured Fibrobacter sp.]
MKILKRLLLCCLWGVMLAEAHPHVFIDATVKVIFDNAGLTSVKTRWVFDETYSLVMMSSGDSDGDGKISEKERDWFFDRILSQYAENNYNTYVQYGTSFLKARELKNFDATFKNNRLILDFETTFDCPVGDDYKMLVVAVADLTNYMLITPDMEQADVDAPDAIDVEFFNDVLKGLTVFRAFSPDLEGLFLRFKKK